jgi:hypothetical protein
MSMQSAEPPSVEKAISKVEDFLAPATRERESNKSVSEKLSTAKGETTLTPEARRDAIRKAGQILKNLNRSIVFEQTNGQKKEAYDSTLLNAVFNLLDVLVLEGIYPALPQGVGNAIDRRAKSLLYRRPDPAYVVLPTIDGLMELAVKVLDDIISNFDAGIEPMLRLRVLTDMIAGNAWLVHSHGSNSFLPKFSQYLNK